MLEGAHVTQGTGRHIPFLRMMALFIASAGCKIASLSMGGLAISS